MDNLNEYIIVDDQGEQPRTENVSDLILELRDKLSVDIVEFNVNEAFTNPVTYERINYLTKFIQNYDDLISNADEIEVQIINGALQEISDLICTNMNIYFDVDLGLKLDDDLMLDIKEYLTNIETLYTFLVIRRYTNIRDYFKNKLLSDRLMYIEKYKNALNDENNNDLFLAQDKKKYTDLSTAIIIHFINDIIQDIRSGITSGYTFFDDIINLDLFEDTNYKMSSLLMNYTNDVVFLDDNTVAVKYLSILDNDEIFVNLRNDLLTSLVQDASVVK